MNHPMTQSAYEKLADRTRRKTEGCSPVMTEGLVIPEETCTNMKQFVWLFFGLFVIAVLFQMYSHHAWKPVKPCTHGTTEFKTTG